MWVERKTKKMIQVQFVQFGCVHPVGLGTSWDSPGPLDPSILWTKQRQKQQTQPEW